MKLNGPEVARLRLAKGWTQSELAKRTGLSQTGISMWELNLRNPSIVNAGRLAAALGVNLADLLIIDAAPVAA